MSYANGTTPVEDCTHIKDLGFGKTRHIRMYGKQFEIVSDPFPDAGGVAVQAITAEDPTRQTVRLPVGILIGLKAMFPK